MITIYAHSITDLMHFSLEDLIKKFKVSSKELRELADKLDKEIPKTEKEQQDEITTRSYYDKIFNSKRKK